MGNYLTIHVGPYIKVYDEPKERIVEETIKTCSNIECDTHGKKVYTKFCGSCGSKVCSVIIEKKQIENFNHWELLEEYGDFDIVYPIYNDNTDKEIILGINYNVEGLNSFGINLYDYKWEYEIPNKEESINIFKNSKEYKPFLEFLDKKKIKYEIKFGITSDYS